jgi:hypothetical protein
VQTDETSATRNLPFAVVGRLVGSGLHDFVALNLTPDVLKGVAFKMPAAARGAQPSTVVLISSSLLMLPGLERRALDPSSIEDPIGNAIVQEIEDSSFDREFMDAFRPTLQDIHRLADLEEGWDSYDASPVEVRTREAAVRFLRQLHRLRRRVPAPSVAASPSGGAILQWDWPGAQLSAEIAQDSLRVFVKHIYGDFSEPVCEDWRRWRSGFDVPRAPSEKPGRTIRVACLAQTRPGWCASLCLS